MGAVASVVMRSQAASAQVPSGIARSAPARTGTVEIVLRTQPEQWDSRSCTRWPDASKLDAARHASNASWFISCLSRS